MVHITLMIATFAFLKRACICGWLKKRCGESSTSGSIAIL